MRADIEVIVSPNRLGAPAMTWWRKRRRLRWSPARASGPPFTRYGASKVRSRYGLRSNISVFCWVTFLIFITDRPGQQPPPLPLDRWSLLWPPRHEQVSSRLPSRLISRASAPEFGELLGKGSALVVTGSSGGRTRRRIHQIAAECVAGVAVREDGFDSAAAGA